MFLIDVRQGGVTIPLRTQFAGLFYLCTRPLLTHAHLQVCLLAVEGDAGEQSTYLSLLQRRGAGGRVGRVQQGKALNPKP